MFDFFAGNIIWGVLSREKATKMASSRNVKQPPGAGMFDPASKLQSNTLKVFCSSELFMNLKCLQFLQQVVYFITVRASHKCWQLISLKLVPMYTDRYCAKLLYFLYPWNSIFWLLAKIMFLMIMRESFLLWIMPQ